MTMIQEIDKLREENARLREALEFYADEDNWSSSTDQGCPAIIERNDIRNHSVTKTRFVGGKRASEALKGGE